MMKGGAVIESNYRYLLWREWNSSGKSIVFVMLNPSRADATVNDRTITRCLQFARSWGYGRLEVVNLFAYRTSKPSLLKQALERTSLCAKPNSAPVSSPIGKDNYRYIKESVARCDLTILAWGNYGIWQQQDLMVFQLLKNYSPFYCLGVTKQGCPRHPLYLKSSTQPQMFYPSRQM